VYPARLLRDLGVELHRVFRGRTGAHRKLRDRLSMALLATLCVDAVATAVMYGLEHGKRGSEITSVFKGFFWVTTQLLTVSSQLKNPVTTGGRIVDILLELWAISVVTAAVGSVAAFFQEK
jgi:hypothetical protein